MSEREWWSLLGVVVSVDFSTYFTPQKPKKKNHVLKQMCACTRTAIAVPRQTIIPSQILLRRPLLFVVCGCCVRRRTADTVVVYRRTGTESTVNNKSNHSTRGYGFHSQTNIASNEWRTTCTCAADGGDALGCTSHCALRFRLLCSQWRDRCVGDSYSRAVVCIIVRQYKVTGSHDANRFHGHRTSQWPVVYSRYYCSCSTCDLWYMYCSATGQGSLTLMLLLLCPRRFLAIDISSLPIAVMSGGGAAADIDGDGYTVSLVPR